MKKLLLIVLSCVLSFSIVGCQNNELKEQQAFDEFMQKIFVEAMEEDYVTAHCYLENPEDFGVDLSQTKVGLGTYFDEESLDEDSSEFELTYKEFQKFDRNLLTEEQQDIYDTYEYQNTINEKLNNEKFDYYSNLFESLSGLHYQIPSLLADWQIRNEEDVKNLILIVKDVLPYINSALSYTKKQEEKGLLMLDLDSIIEYCQTIVDKGTKSTILSSMKKSIEELSLDQQKTIQYQKQITEAFQTSFIPAYQNIIKTMKDFQKTGKNNTEGLTKFKEGKEYYSLLLQNSIGTTKSVSEVKKMMEDNCNQHLKKMMNILIANPDIMTIAMTNDFPSTKYKSYQQILDDNKDNIKNDFPKVNNLRYHIEDINEEIASNSGVSAYFNIPTIDGDSIKQLRVNPKGNDINTIDTYTTVSHEGFPGHMYQYAYMYENVDSLYIKSLANVLAYTEGYATYAQYESLKYLDIDQEVLELYKENELAIYSAIIVCDIGIHYEGWSIDKLKDYLSSVGFSLDEDSAKKQYYQLQANPVAFEPYYVGYYEIDLLKENAKKELGNQFNELKFNQALLESGTAPFSVVERHIQKYINSK